MTILIGDCRDLLPTLPAEHYHCVATSPPYWGLRDYGVKGQIGLEKTPEKHIEALVGVFREVRRVLRPDGTLWLNYGDAYAQSGGKQQAEPLEVLQERAKRRGYDVGAWGAKAKDGQGIAGRAANTAISGLKPKDLIMMPHRLALALQADGWWVRSDCVWHKPNPMPESVTDRPTRAHEYVFLLSKSARYFYDADAVREALSAVALEQIEYAKRHRFTGEGRSKLAPERGDGDSNVGAGGKHARAARGAGMNPAGRNMRSVWTIATKPYSGAHFATFPPELAQRCIMAGTSERGCCSGCGAPWVRVTSPAKGGTIGTADADWKTAEKKASCGKSRNALGGQKLYSSYQPRTTTGWRPSCDCGAEAAPCRVLDPFGGSGTVGEVAEVLGRHWTICELSEDYAELARKRTRQMGLFG